MPHAACAASLLLLVAGASGNAADLVERTSPSPVPPSYSLVADPNSASCHDHYNASHPLVYPEDCCAHISNTHWPKFDVHACLNATLHRVGPTFDNATVDVVLAVGSDDVFNRTYPIGKLERECVRIKKVVDVCADFSHLGIEVYEG